MERKLTAILCADVHGYSRLMGEDEEATIIAYIELGREQEARAEATELKRISPHFMAHVEAKVSRDPAGQKRMEDDLRKAGLN